MPGGARHASLRRCVDGSLHGAASPSELEPPAASLGLLAAAGAGGDVDNGRGRCRQAGVHTGTRGGLSRNANDSAVPVSPQLLAPRDRPGAQRRCSSRRSSGRAAEQARPSQRHTSQATSAAIGPARTDPRQPTTRRPAPAGATRLSHAATSGRESPAGPAGMCLWPGLTHSPSRQASPSTVSLNMRRGACRQLPRLTPPRWKCASQTPSRCPTPYACPPAWPSSRP